jgi:tetratricopeptide (TPR) repeat protein
MTDQPEQTRAYVHMGIAEYGKLSALRGDYVNALKHYREAMAMAAREGSPQLIMRHYLECVLETLELMGSYPELHEYCDRAVEHYRLHPPETPLTYFDLATIYQRRGVVYLKQGDRAHATEAFERAAATARSIPVSIPLTDTLLGWCRAQLTVSVARIMTEQEKQRYFSVRTETIRPERAVCLTAAEREGDGPDAR